MAWLRTETDRVVITLSGFSFCFKANVPKEIPDVAVQACLAEGCLMADPTAKTVVAEKATVVVNTEPDNFQDVDEAIRQVVDKGDPADFKTDKTPKSQVVNALLDKRRSASVIAERFAEIITFGNAD